MDNLQTLIREYAKACRTLQKNSRPLASCVDELNTVTRKRRALLRAILDENGFFDVKIY